MKLILASASASRRAMLDAAGVVYEVHASDVDEEVIKTERAAASMAELALALATAKARQIAQAFPDALVLGGDSIASIDGQRFGKPKSREDAAGHLRYFSGKMLMLTSAAALVCNAEVRTEIVDTAELQVRELSDAFITHYLDAEWPAISGCAGCFRMEAMGVQLFSTVSGSHFTILGMPLIPLLSALRDEGVLAL
jgi:septum formation protein